MNSKAKLFYCVDCFGAVCKECSFVKCDKNEEFIYCKSCYLDKYVLSIGGIEIEYRGVLK